MGTVAEKLTYLNTTKSNLKDRINYLGGEINNNTTFRNYATELDSIYNKLPKTSNTGANISLAPTLKGRLGSELKGDTKQKLLPNGYTQLEYIESTGTGSQYINTGVYPTSNTKIDIDLMYSGSNGTNPWSPLYGERGETNQTYFCLFINKDNLKVSPNYAGFDPGANSQTTVEKNVRYNFKNIGGQFYVNNELKSDLSTNNVLTTSTKPIYLFEILFNNGNVSGRYPMLKIYGCKLYEGDELIRNFIPCSRDSDTEIGLYDLVNNTFYTNQGTDSFAYGSVAPTPEAPVEIQNVTGTQNVVVSDNNNNSQEVQLNLGDIELCKIGTYQDKIYKNNGKWYLHKETKKYIIDTSQISLISYTNINYATISKSSDYKGYNAYSNELILCDRASYVLNWTADDTNNINKVIAVFNKTQWWLGFPVGTSLNDMKNALTGGYIIYPLVAPTDTEITDTALLNQLENIYNLYSYDGTTNIETTGNLPIVITASAIKGI